MIIPFTLYLLQLLIKNHTDMSGVDLLIKNKMSNYYLEEWFLHPRDASVAKLSSGVGSSEFPSPAPEGTDRIWRIQEVGGRVLTSVTINHTHYGTVL